jgi:hypothetical protein
LKELTDDKKEQRPKVPRQEYLKCWQTTRRQTHCLVAEASVQLGEYLWDAGFAVDSL